MDDLKREDGQSRFDIIHDDNVRQGSTKRKMLDQVQLGHVKILIPSLVNYIIQLRICHLELQT